ncbi:hypothetical protein D3C80_1638880 [compost metagenome]
MHIKPPALESLFFFGKALSSLSIYLQTFDRLHLFFLLSHVVHHVAKYFHNLALGRTFQMQGNKRRVLGRGSRQEIHVWQI